jgi:hypothetical protein
LLLMAVSFIRLVTTMAIIKNAPLQSKMLPSALWHGVFICKKDWLKMCMTKEAGIMWKEWT